MFQSNLQTSPTFSNNLNLICPVFYLDLIENQLLPAQLLTTLQPIPPPSIGQKINLPHGTFSNPTTGQKKSTLSNFFEYSYFGSVLLPTNSHTLSPFCRLISSSWSNTIVKVSSHFGNVCACLSLPFFCFLQFSAIVASYNGFIILAAFGINLL